MDEQDCGDLLDSLRELSAFELRIQTAQSKVEVAEILHRHDLPEEFFTQRFPDLAKTVQQLPDETSPTA
ncbi:hypothetical protein [Streptomyces sp. Go-475]|uniref:hypothetical protein n=1 Tax=Streptomyces sp. Go-475 TaxID=2072505 RepID=UPI000DEFADAA|nr:hypothetical protein [Streptomyces sp. Go-475]AXE86193.1 hypothetical protein C1703_14380 [Streptomyces sp. Go-475]